MNAPISTRSCPTHNVVCPSCVSTLALETLGVMQLWQRMLLLLVRTDASCAIVCPVCVLCFATGARRGAWSFDSGGSLNTQFAGVLPASSWLKRLALTALPLAPKTL